MSDADAAPTRPRVRWWWVLILIAFGALGLSVAAPDSDVLRAAWTRVGAYPITAIAIVVGGAIGLVVTEAIRISAIGALLGVRIRAHDAWDAAVANHVMTAITPQVGLGEPTVALTLMKRGVPIDAAVAIPFLKFSSSLALVFAIGALLVAVGAGPPVEGWMTVFAILWFAAISLLALGALAVFSRPAIAGRWIARLAAWVKRRRVFAAAGWQDRIDRAAAVTMRTVERLESVRSMRNAGFLALIAIQLVYYASYVAPLVGLALVLGDPPLVTITLRAFVYLCFVFAMPTPGAAGPSEAAAGLFFADLLTPADAIVAVVVFRAATFYLQLAIGALYLPIRSLAR